MTMRIAAALFTLLVLIGCTSTKNVDLSLSPVQRIEAININDSIVIQTKDFKEIELTVSEINEREVIGDDIRVNFSDMASLKVKKLSAVRTLTASVVGYTAITFIVYLLIGAIYY